MVQTFKILKASLEKPSYEVVWNPQFKKGTRNLTLTLILALTLTQTLTQTYKCNNQNKNFRKRVTSPESLFILPRTFRARSHFE